MALAIRRRACVALCERVSSVRKGVPRVDRYVYHLVAVVMNALW